MSYVNGGVHGARTKAALKAAVKKDPASVTFYSTAMYGEQFNGPVADIPDGVTLSVVGPDPERDRRWYASIRKGPKGITVS